MRHIFHLSWAMALLLVLVACTPAVGKVTVGDRVPEVTLPNWEGQPVTLAKLRGKVVVIDFWASWCAICRQALPALDAIGQRFAGAPVVVVGINVDKARAAADRFLSTYLPSPRLLFLYDPEAEMLSRFGAEGMPAVYVVDPNGIVRFAESGYAPERLNTVEQVIRQYLPQAARSEP